MFRMRKMKLLLCILLAISMFTIDIHAFEGNHQRNGIFYLAHEDNPATLIKANYLTVVWESGIVKYFTKEDGGKVRIRKGEENGGYQEVQVIPIDEQEIILNKACEVHSYPMEYKEYKTGKVLQPGTYKVNKFTVGWLGVVNEDGSTSWIHPNRNENYDYVGGKNAYFKDGKSTLSVSQINGISLSTQYLLKNTNNSVRPGYASSPQYVTIHNTDNTASGANALTHAKIQYNRQNNNEVWTSWHFQVDDHSIYQSIPMDEVVWHAGDGSMQGNTTIGIEICENSDGNYAKAEKNAAYLTAQILFELGLPKNAIRMHKDWSGKTCPRNIINGTKGTMGWDAFKSTVAKYYDQLVEENKTEEIVEIDEIFTTMASEIGYASDKNILYRIPVNTTMEQLSNQIKAYNDSAIITFMDSDDTPLTEGILKTGYKMKVVMEEKQEVSEPEVPEEPVEPEVPTEPEVPSEPTEPESPTEPVEPEQPDESTNPETPEVPEEPTEPENPDGAETPAEPEDSEETNQENQISTVSEPVVKECTFLLSVIGDVNGDGKIYATDYVKIKNHIMGKITIKGSYLFAADVNNDGNIYATDYVKIKNFIMEKITELK